MRSADRFSRDIVSKSPSKAGVRAFFNLPSISQNLVRSMENRELRGLNNMGVSVMRDENLTLEDPRTSHTLWDPKTLVEIFFVFIRTDQVRDTGNKYGGCCLL